MTFWEISAKYGWYFLKSQKFYGRNKVTKKQNYIKRYCDCVNKKVKFYWVKCKRVYGGEYRCEICGKTYFQR